MLGEFYKDELTQEQKDFIVSVKGLGIDDALYTPIRDYPMDEYMAHIVGYTGFYTGDDMPEGYTASDKMGLTGLEAAYESELRGSSGKIVYIKDKWGKNIRTLYLDPCDEGQDLRLTIDPILQKRALDALTEFLNIEEEETGVVIVMDASNGYVQAMASLPGIRQQFLYIRKTSGLLGLPKTHQKANSQCITGRLRDSTRRAAYLNLLRQRLRLKATPSQRTQSSPAK